MLIHKHLSWFGLSPRVRGNLPFELECAPTSGSIPACAGEPSGPSIPAGFAMVYPRVCGGTTAWQTAL